MKVLRVNIKLTADVNHSYYYNRKEYVIQMVSANMECTHIYKYMSNYTTAFRSWFLIDRTSLNINACGKSNSWNYSQNISHKFVQHKEMITLINAS